ncbi:hypothetical protein TNCT_216641 [Trichonephila clavata]|uniref:Uncharacterized protein n=1 Tax=Trichonephila clavata TaxID=2740835 RepID=A0A8X6KCA2_TRICU|nr:hypothetical protein TNCT_216641 [Trichonephila clavata]
MWMGLERIMPAMTVIFVNLSCFKIVMSVADSLSFLSILILTTSCLTFTSRAEETEPTEDILQYLWSLMHPQGEEQPDFKEMFLKMT